MLLQPNHKRLRKTNSIFSWTSPTLAAIVSLGLIAAFLPACSPTETKETVLEKEVTVTKTFIIKENCFVVTNHGIFVIQARSIEAVNMYATLAPEHNYLIKFKVGQGVGDWNSERKIPDILAIKPLDMEVTTK